ncbi:Leucine-responsive regulatory protein [Kluyvera cryocrescens]|uniref:Leucine-responsive regulatory protein n=1 Tax=Kluyvera cryocrescens TaxID=580 RepID=A0A485AB07_KLUCR|nr:Leucine-responsive regulatory protein [Kluyvera cryocrescens]
MVDSKKRPGKDLDRIDRNILNELQKDGRISNVELSKRVGLSPTPVPRARTSSGTTGVYSGLYRAAEPRIIWTHHCWYLLRLL